VSEKEVSKNINIEIDGKIFYAKPGETIIEVADRNRIYIPRFCYHKKLSVAANCRMCLVDVKDARRSAPACATQVMNNMVIKTKSEKAHNMQKSVMEFLLANHPLDCPICDQGGECELQDIAFSYGTTNSDYRVKKHTVDNPYLGPLIDTQMNKCILCARCVRFFEEIENEKELGIINRAEHSCISACNKDTPLKSELSGNIIDLCPVGALTSKPFKYLARAWELKQRPSVSAGDGLCLEMNSHNYDGQLVRSVPRENNLTTDWISDRDRFEYTGLYSENRLKTPIIKKNDQWIDVTWEEALDFVRQAVETTIHDDGAEAIAAICSENSTTEELYLLQKLIHRLGSNKIDTRIMQSAYSSGISAGLGLNCSLKDIQESDLIFSVGSFLRQEYPIINNKVKQAVKNGAKAYSWSCHDYDFNYHVEERKTAINDVANLLLSLLKAVKEKMACSYKAGKLEYFLGDIAIDDSVRNLAFKIISAKSPIILIGQDLIRSRDFDFIFTIFSILQEMIGIKGGYLSIGANSAGAIVSKAVPGYDIEDKKNLTNFSSYKYITGKQKAALLFAVNTDIRKDNPWSDTLADNALANTDIVVSLNSHISESIKSYADIILPIATHYETNGSFIDICGDRKSFNAIVKPYAQSMELWRVIKVTGDIIGLDGFDYTDVKEIMSEALKQNIVSKVDYSSLLLDLSLVGNRNYSFMSKTNMYSHSTLLRNAKPLHKSIENKAYSDNTTRISFDIAKNIGIEDFVAKNKIKIYNIDYSIEYLCVADKNLPANTVIIPREQMAEFIINSDAISIKLVE